MDHEASRQMCDRIDRFLGCREVYRESVSLGRYIPPPARNYIKALEEELAAVEEIRLMLSHALEKRKIELLNQIYGE